MLTFSKLLNIANLGKSEVARILGVVPSSITSRINGTDDLKISELEKIEEYVGHKIYRASENCEHDDLVSIPYLSIPGIPDELIKTTRIKKQLQFDREVVVNYWAKNPENLRITKMIGDKMDGGQYALKNNDILIVDISSTNPLIPGVYVCTFNKTQLFIASIAGAADGGLDVHYYNTERYKDHKYTAEQLKKYNFEVHAKVVKNQSLTI